MSPESPTVFWTNLTCLPAPRFCQILPNMQQYFPNHWSMEIFFCIWDRRWSSDKCAWRLLYSPYLGSLGFNFYLDWWLLNKFGVVELLVALNFHKGTLPSHVVAFSFQKLCMFRRIRFLYTRDRLLYGY